MANGSKDGPPSIGSLTPEEAERLAELLRPSWDPGVDLPLGAGKPQSAPLAPRLPTPAGVGLSATPKAPRPSAGPESAPASSGRSNKQTLTGLQPAVERPTEPQRPEGVAVPANPEPAPTATRALRPAPRKSGTEPGSRAGEGKPIDLSSSAAAPEPRVGAPTHERESVPEPLEEAPDSGWDHQESSMSDAQATPVEVRFSGSDLPMRAFGALPAEPSRPTGVARSYVPKEGADTPAVVVDAAALSAGESAARAEAAAARRARTPRRANSATIPGTLRAIPRGSNVAPAIEPLHIDFRKPKRARLLVLVFFGVAATSGAFFFLRPTQQPRTEATIAVPASSPLPIVSTQRATPALSAVSLAQPARRAASAGVQAPAKAPAPAKAQAPAPAKAQAPAPAKAPAPAAKKAMAKKPASSSAMPAPAPKSKPVLVRELPF